MPIPVKPAAAETLSIQSRHGSNMPPSSPQPNRVAVTRLSSPVSSSADRFDGVFCLSRACRRNNNSNASFTPVAATNH